MFIIVFEEFFWGVLLILSLCRNFIVLCFCVCEVVDLFLGIFEEEIIVEEWFRFLEIEIFELVLLFFEDCS